MSRRSAPTTASPSRELAESAKIVDLSCGECNVPGPSATTAETWSL